MFLKVLLYVLLPVDAYLLIDFLWSHHFGEKTKQYLIQRNNQYYNNLIKQYEKNKKIKIKQKSNFIKNIHYKLFQLGIQNSIFVNACTIILCSVIIFLISFFGCFYLFHTVLLSALVSLPTLLIPSYLLNFFAETQREKIEKASLDFLLQLKNYVQINNDIVYAMEEVKTMEPLQSHINTFVIEIKSGIRFDKAINHLQEKIPNETLKQFFGNLEYCFLYGGNYATLISKSYQMISELQKEKEKRMTETKSARLVLFLLIIMDIIVYLNTIKNDFESYEIMRKSFVGNAILYWNFGSMWILIILAEGVKKLDF